MATEKPDSTDVGGGQVSEIRRQLDRQRLRRRILVSIGLLVFLVVIIGLLKYLGFYISELTSQRAQKFMGRFIGGLFPPDFVDFTTHTQNLEDKSSGDTIGNLEALYIALGTWGVRNAAFAVPPVGGAMFFVEIPLPVPVHIFDTIAEAEAGSGFIITSAAVTTVAAGLTGTVLGFPLALLFGVLGSERVTPFPFNFIFRGVMSTIRAIPAIVWTLVYIPIFGIAPATGVLAIATDTIGNLGRLFTDELEEIDEGPIEAIESTGAGRSQTVIFGMLSQVTNSFIAWTMYILEINTRIAISLGVLGVGGLGMYIDNQLGQLKAGYPNATAGLFTVIFIVISIEFLSSRVRSYLRPSEHEAKSLFQLIMGLFDPYKWAGMGATDPKMRQVDEEDDE